MVSIHTFLGIGNSVGRRLMLNLVWEKLARSILTASPFWPEFRKLIFWHVFDFFSDINYIHVYILKRVWNILCWILWESSHLAHVWHLFIFWLEFCKTIGKHVFGFFLLFFSFFHRANSVGRLFILNLVLERLSGSILTAFDCNSSFGNAFVDICVLMLVVILLLLLPNTFVNCVVT